MSSHFPGKRKRHPQLAHTAAEQGALILSGDAAQVDYEDDVPVWKQEVVDERGRKRLHGAFTGGFSAGYFNSVGSAEGWVPSTYVSSRSARFKAVEKKAVDYMDEEDLADIVDDRDRKVRSDAAAKAEAENDEDDGSSAAQPKAKEKLPNTDLSPDKPTSATTVLSVIAKNKKPKPLVLLDEDDDLDAFDIGPKIKYDKTLAKKKKKAVSSAATQHTFQGRKTMRNPEPEPELVQPPMASADSGLQSRQSDNLLPSIGEGIYHAPTIKNFTQVHGDFADTGDANSRVESIQSIPPWRQASSTAASEEKLPPWRRKPKPLVDVPGVGPHVAALALQSNFSPYANNAEKHQRYRDYLEIEAGTMNVEHTQGDLEPDTWRAECEEFQKCAMMYKPMTGAMSQKFTTSKFLKHPGEGDPEEDGVSEHVQLSSQKQAAKEGRYGHLTRAIEPWTPNKLLCKRFTVMAPDVVSGDRAGHHEDHGPSATEVHKQALEKLMKSM